ncbi:hypothetical protein G9A89_023937 [Geosiphon pyriformis]|nr:hypothetical protein G9A89_023937 [Geosiphon pyriformis]
MLKDVCKVTEVLGWLLSIKLLFKNKLSVSILGLYAGASLMVWFSQTDEVNSLIAKTVNESSFIVLGDDFNEDGLHKSSPVVKSPTWENSRGVKKTIDFVLVLSNLVNAVVDHNVVNKSFKDATLANVGMFTNEFAATVQLSDLDIIVKFASLLDTWCGLDANGALVLLESRHTEKACIKAAINKRMESFESDKGYTIRSVLEHFFHKVVLDHLVVSNELVLEPSLVKSRVDGIMESWTRKHKVMPDILDKWLCQYWPLEYVFDGAFFGMMCSVGVNKLLSVISDLPKGKAAGLSGISNEL